MVTKQHVEQLLEHIVNGNEYHAKRILTETDKMNLSGTVEDNLHDILELCEPDFTDDEVKDIAEGKA